MFAKSIILLMALGAVAARQYAGVNPNSLSCDPAGQVFLLLPSYTDCSGYYMCAHGREVWFNCPASLIFDFELQGCDWDWRARCILRTKEEEEEGSGFDGFLGEEPRILPSVALIEADESVPEKKAAEFSGILDCNNSDAAARHIPYKGDCQRYWRCVGGVPHTFFCSDGLFFNAETQTCDFEANAKCNLEEEHDELQGEFIVYK